MCELTRGRPRQRNGLPRTARICGGRLQRCRATAVLPPSGMHPKCGWECVSAFRCRTARPIDPPRCASVRGPCAPAHAPTVRANARRGAPRAGRGREPDAALPRRAARRPRAGAAASVRARASRRYGHKNSGNSRSAENPGQNVGVTKYPERMRFFWKKKDLVCAHSRTEMIAGQTCCWAPVAV